MNYAVVFQEERGVGVAFGGQVDDGKGVHYISQIVEVDEVADSSQEEGSHKKLSIVSLLLAVGDFNLFFFF